MSHTEARPSLAARRCQGRANTPATLPSAAGTLQTNCSLPISHKVGKCHHEFCLYVSRKDRNMKCLGSDAHESGTGSTIVFITIGVTLGYITLVSIGAFFISWPPEVQWDIFFFV